MVRMTKNNKDNKKNESIGGKIRNSYCKREQKPLMRLWSEPYYLRFRKGLCGTAHTFL